jgi:hypothetical protein
MSYLMTPLGFLLFVLNLPFGPTALRFDSLTGTVETSNGAVVNFLFAVSPNPATGFNLGNFTFIRVPPGGSPFAGGGSGLSPHETGHTLTVAALGGFYGWINAIDQNVPPLRRGARAYGELVPESHFGGTGRPFVPVW